MMFAWRLYSRDCPNFQLLAFQITDLTLCAAINHEVAFLKEVSSTMLGDVLSPSQTYGTSVASPVLFQFNTLIFHRILVRRLRPVLSLWGSPHPPTKSTLVTANIFTAKSSPTSASHLLGFSSFVPVTATTQLKQSTAIFPSALCQH